MYSFQLMLNIQWKMNPILFDYQNSFTTHFICDFHTNKNSEIQKTQLVFFLFYFCFLHPFEMYWGRFTILKQENNKQKKPEFLFFFPFHKKKKPKKCQICELTLILSESEIKFHSLFLWEWAKPHFHFKNVS